MKKISSLPVLIPFLSLLASCATPRPPCVDEVVCQTHLHRYGVPLDCNDWCQRGQDGQVISTLKSGVVVATNYDKGVVNGETTYTFPHRDVIQRREVFDHGTLLEKFEYYPNGLPFRQTSYESPVRYSAVQWFENGAPQCRETYENDLLCCGEYYTMDHLVESRVDDRTGSRVVRDGLGQLVSTDTIQGGQMMFQTTYYPNGSPLAVTPYFNRMVEGERRTYSPCGEPLTIEQWRNGVQEGNTVVFECGDKVADAPYVRGRKHGIEKCYRDNGGVLVSETQWVKGVRHGRCKTYINEVSTEDWYFRDRLVNKATFDMLCTQ